MGLLASRGSTTRAHGTHTHYRALPGPGARRSLERRRGSTSVDSLFAAPGQSPHERARNTFVHSRSPPTAQLALRRFEPLISQHGLSVSQWRTARSVHNRSGQSAHECSLASRQRHCWRAERRRRRSLRNCACVRLCARCGSAQQRSLPGALCGGAAATSNARTHANGSTAATTTAAADLVIAASLRRLHSARREPTAAVSADSLALPLLGLGLRCLQSCLASRKLTTDCCQISARPETRENIIAGPAAGHSIRRPAR